VQISSCIELKDQIVALSTGLLKDAQGRWHWRHSVLVVRHRPRHAHLRRFELGHHRCARHRRPHYEFLRRAATAPPSATIAALVAVRPRLAWHRWQFLSLLRRNCEADHRLIAGFFSLFSTQTRFKKKKKPKKKKKKKRNQKF
jgi:hypothetical protein